VIRRQAKVAARLNTMAMEPRVGTSGRTAEMANAKLPKNKTQRDEVMVNGAVMAGLREHSRVGNQQGSTALSKAQINVVKTMVYITVCFTVCWMPMYFNVLFKKVTVRQINSF